MIECLGRCILGLASSLHLNPHEEGTYISLRIVRALSMHVRLSFSQARYLLTFLATCYIGVYFHNIPSSVVDDEYFCDFNSKQYIVVTKTAS